MKKILPVGLCVALFASIASAIIMDEHPVFLNGKPFGKAVMINGVLAMSVLEFAKGAGAGNTLEPFFTLQGNTLTAKVKVHDISITHSVDKASPMLARRGSGGGAGSPNPLFGVRKAGVVSTHVFMNNGQAFMPFADVTQAFGIIINWSNLRSREAINLNSTVNGDGILGASQ